MTDLRSQLRTKRQSLSSDDRQEKSLAIASNLSRYLPFIRTPSLGLYHSMNEEVNTEPLLTFASEQNKDIFLPVINDSNLRKDAMLFARYIPGVTRIRKNRFGIAEPDAGIGECIRASELPFLCVPMVGFNRHCDRIGMGAGYYDRALDAGSFRKPHLVGLAFACQVAVFEPAAHDVPMDAVITEEGTLLKTKSGQRQH